jgi:hypothetical protein
MALPSYTDIWELVKAGSAIEAKAKIMELREAVLTLQEENIELREQIISVESGDGEVCPLCTKKTWVVESSELDHQFGERGTYRRNYVCSECGFEEFRLITGE